MLHFNFKSGKIIVSFFKKYTVFIAIGFVTGIFGGGVIILIAFHPMSRNLAAIAEWFSAFGTVGAVIVSLYLSRKERIKIEVSARQKILNANKSEIGTQIDISNLSNVNTTLRVLQYQIQDSRLDDLNAEDRVELALAGQAAFDFSQFSDNNDDETKACMLTARITKSIKFNWSVIDTVVRANGNIFNAIRQLPREPLHAILVLRDIDGNEYSYLFDENDRIKKIN